MSVGFAVDVQIAIDVGVVIVAVDDVGVDVLVAVEQMQVSYGR